MHWVTFQLEANFSGEGKRKKKVTQGDIRRLFYLKTKPGNFYDRLVLCKYLAGWTIDDKGQSFRGDSQVYRKSFALARFGRDWSGTLLPLAEASPSQISEFYLKSRWDSRTYQAWDKQGKRSIAPVVPVQPPGHVGSQSNLVRKPHGSFEQSLSCFFFFFLTANLWVELSGPCVDPSRAVTRLILTKTRGLQSSYGFVLTTSLLRQGSVV